MVFTCCVVEGVTIVLAPLGANSGSSLYDGSTLIVDSMNASTCWAGQSDVEDFDDFRQAQLAYAALLAQGLMNAVETFISAEGTGSEWGFGAAAVEIGAGGGGEWFWKRARIWIGVVVVGGLRVSVVYSIHVHVHGAGRVVEVNRVSFESCLNFLYKFGIEVEGVSGLQVLGVHGVIFADLV